MITCDKMTSKILVIFVISCLIFPTTFSANFRAKSSELSEPRTVEKSFKLLHGLYKMFNAMKSNSNGENKLEKAPRQMIPYNGLSHDANDYNRRVTSIDRFPTLADIHKEEGIMDDNDKHMTKKEEPQFWLFDKFSKKTDLVLLTKVLLKIIIFKKIVKFIALVCLLFFIPAFKDENAETEEKDARNLDVYGEFAL